MPTPTTLHTAQLLADQGISTIQVKADKRPTGEWKKYQSTIPTPEELVKWFKTGSASIALCAGEVFCIDFDDKYSKGIFQRFKQRARDAGLAGLIDELILQQTPSGGQHLIFRCPGNVLGNLKLAQKENLEVMIETRGRGGYFLISPSKGYTLLNGDWTSIPVISEEDRDGLLDLARSFDERRPLDADHRHPSPADSGPTPGDDYDFRSDIPALLRKHGWKPAGGSEKYWTRPGKARGISASWDVVPDRLWVFSSSTAFEPNHVYRPWHVYAMLECGGDFSKAAHELRRQGFGAARPLPKDPKPIPADYEEEDPPGVEGVDPSGEAPTKETEDDRIRRMLAARSWDPSAEPPPVRPIFTLGGVVICTPGNLTAITAQAKVGKSALVSALTAAAMSHPEEEADCLTAQGFNEAGKGFLYFDTEQSPDDFWHAVNRARRRAKVSHLPPWIQAYSIADLPADISRKALKIAMADMAKAYDGLHAVIVDGIADLCLDVNDAAECNSIVAELHSLAIRYDCPVISVIHKNPGTEKVRGHLGSQLERKAETNLSLDKEDGVTVVWSHKQRRGPIEKKDGPRFAWSDDMKMHVTVPKDSVDSKQSRTVLDMLELAQTAFLGKERMSWADLMEALKAARTFPSGKPPGDSTTFTWRKKLLDAGIIVFEFGYYRLSDAAKL